MVKVNNKDTIGFVLVSLLLTLNIFTTCSTVSTVNFEHVLAGWGMAIWTAAYLEP